MRPNAPCECGSGKKFKKCCGRPAPYKEPEPDLRPRKRPSGALMTALGMLSMAQPMYPGFEDDAQKAMEKLREGQKGKA